MNIETRTNTPLLPRQSKAIVWDRRGGTNESAPEVQANELACRRQVTGWLENTKFGVLKLQPPRLQTLALLGLDPPLLSIRSAHGRRGIVLNFKSSKEEKWIILTWIIQWIAG